jgi:hypothetical protein
MDLGNIESRFISACVMSSLRRALAASVACVLQRSAAQFKIICPNQQDMGSSVEKSGWPLRVSENDSPHRMIASNHWLAGRFALRKPMYELKLYVFLWHTHKSGLACSSYHSYANANPQQFPGLNSERFTTAQTPRKKSRFIVFPLPSTQLILPGFPQSAGAHAKFSRALKSRFPI